MAIKMIGLDLDGTTLSTDRNFTQRTVDTLYRAIEKGVEIVIATGRAERSLPEKIYEIDGLRYVATSNGARVIDILSGNVIYESYINEDRIPEVHRVLRELDADIEVFFDGVAYIGSREYESIISGRNKTRNKDYIIKSRTPADNIFDLLIQNKHKIENININYTELEQRFESEKVLKKIERR